MTDEELDREWKPNGRRPQSTIARMFSEELMDIFRIDNSVADLDEKVDKRKQQITTQTSELEALEARIREMEKRLKSPPGADSPDHDASSPRPAPPEKDYPVRSRVPEPQQQQHKYGGSRPGTARQSQQAVPGALPPTPVGSEGECDPPVARPSTVAPRAPAQSHLSGSRPSTETSPSPPKRKTTPGRDSASVKSMSASSAFTDYVIVPDPDGDRERDV
ncbi:hypothetical protein BT67DRAFT_376174 [Trichocladium antarcticum]|uniref:Uncharacterized protein n=1 Tax=Trichocladium antarcticum TaxID=1450529 RepID=A0AAN6UN50_9PEZI|nr:hypothetical protein BT67DRAFT_376174 [Trichocladium antarcticum]